MIVPKKQLGFALPIAIFIVAVLIIAGGAGYYFYKTSWETYENEEHGFEMKYPRDMRYKKISVSTIEFAYPNQKFTDNTGIYAELPILGNASVVVRIGKNISYKDYLAAVKSKKIIAKEIEVSINGVSFKQVDGVWKLVEGAVSQATGTSVIYTFVMKNSVIYDIVYYQLPNETDYVNDYYKILSTFRFLE